jgi:excisionase family DNA binding protein
MAAKALISTKFLTVRATAERLSVCTRTVERLIHSGKLPVVKIGRATRIGESELEKFIANNTYA